MLPFSCALFCCGYIISCCGFKCSIHPNSPGIPKWLTISPDQWCTCNPEGCGWNWFVTNHTKTRSGNCAICFSRYEKYVHITPTFLGNWSAKMFHIESVTFLPTYFFFFFDFHMQLDEVCNIEISPELILNLNSPECAWHIFNLQLPNRFETLHKARQKLLVNRNVCWCENLTILSLRWVPDRHHTLRSDIWISVLWVKWKEFSSIGTHYSTLMVILPMPCWGCRVKPHGMAVPSDAFTHGIPFLFIFSIS